MPVSEYGGVHYFHSLNTAESQPLRSFLPACSMAGSSSPPRARDQVVVRWSRGEPLGEVGGAPSQ